MNYPSPKPVAVALLLVLAWSSAAYSDLQNADELYREGQFEEAAEAYEAVDGDQRAAAAVGASRSYALTGNYEQALQVCEEAMEREEDAAVAVQMAEVLFATGRSGEALELLEPVVDQRDVPLRALVVYGDILHYRGRHEDADVYLQAAVADYSGRINLNSEDVALAARAYQFLGNFERANELFRDATRRDPYNMEAQVWWGDLFAEKYNEAEAAQSYQSVLDYNPNYLPAIVGYARVSRDDSALEQALFINPQSPEAFLAYGELALEKNRLEEAASYFNAALPGNPESVEVLSYLAGIAKLRGNEQEYQKWRDRVAEVRPDSAEFRTIIAEMFAHDYRFREAASFAREAIELRDDYWRAYTVLGTNLARMGQEEEGRRYLEEGFDADPYNVRSSNMLKVFDTLDDFTVRESEHFRVRLSERDALVLWPYMEGLLEDAWDRMVDKYGFTPEAPVLVEVFDDRQDFAVRSVGLPDLGPLVGICFGQLITLISPDALSANWEEIVWHEFVHVITLQMTDNRIPRWLSEGISVYEEFQGQSEWGRHQNLDVARALQEDRILPVERMDDAFIGAGAEDLNLAYLQAYLVVEHIVDQYGFDQLKRMINAYGEQRDTEAIVARVFDQDIDQFNENFTGWLQQRVETLDVYVHQEDEMDEGAAHGHGSRSNPSAMLAELYSNASIKAHMLERVEEEPRDFQAHLQLGIVFFNEDDYRQAERHLLKAKEILPRYTADPSPSRVLIELYQARGDEEKYWEELAYLVKYHQHDAEAPLELAEHAMEQGDRERARYYLERSIAVDPYQLPVHRQLAELGDATGDHRLSIREYEIISELDDTDPVDAYTRLAEAYLRGGQQDRARHNSLRALEIAPTYRDAQAVLLEAVEE